MGISRNALRVLAATAAGCCLTAGSAQAASIVYIKGGNVYIANADGTGEHQVTTNGAPATSGTSTQPSGTAYRSPTIADNGTILAAKGGELFRLNENGTVISHSEPSTHAYPLETAISPDGGRLTYNFSEITQCTTYDDLNCGYYPQPGAEIENVDGTGAQSINGQHRSEQGAWIDNSTVALDTDSNYVDYATTGGTEASWFSPEDQDGFNNGYYHGGYNSGITVSRKGDLLALAMQAIPAPSVGQILELYTLAAPPPAVPKLVCEFATDSKTFTRPAIAPDDSSIDWTDSAGIETVAIPSDCLTSSGTVQQYTLSTTDGPLIAGASDLSFGLAANNPQPLPSTTTTTPGGSTSTPGTSTTPGSGTSTTSGAATPGAATPGPSAGTALTLSLRGPALLTASAAAKGIPVTLGCSTACSYTATLTISASAAKKLGLAPRHAKQRRHRGTPTGPVTVGTASGQTSSGTVDVPLSGKAARALKHLHGRLAVTVTVKASAAGAAAVTKATVVPVKG